MLLLVTAMAMPKMAWAETYNQNGFAEAGSYQPATLTTGQYDINGDGTKDEVYEIGNAGQLYWFAGLVNGTIEGETQNASANAVLTADITVNTGVLNENGTLNNNGSGLETWTPIGNSESYTGTFDGQGHTISGLYFNNSENNVVGLFGGNSGTIKNVGVVDSYFYGYDVVGGVCGYNDGTITGCYNTGSVSGNERVGGVCGDNFGGTITGCHNTGTVSGNMLVGGVCGHNTGGTITGCYTNSGGVCGVNEGTIKDCDVKSDNAFKNGTVCTLLNNALKKAKASVRFYQGTNYPELFMNVPSLVDDVYQISNKEELYAFALLVNKNVETSANAVLTANITVNTGVLKSDGTLADNYSDFETWTPIGNNQKPYTGTFDGQGHTISGLYFNDVYASYVGLFGGNCGTIKNVGVVDSYFYGSDLVGGVCGWTYKSTLENCYNKGTVSSKGYAGGICGSVSEGTIRDCYNTGSVNGTWYVGGVCGLVSDEDDKSYIINCYNTGDVKGGSQDLCCTGGVCGLFTSSIGSNCYNTGTVGATAGNIGAVFGRAEGSYFNNCYYPEDCNAEGVSFTNEFGTKMSSDAFGSGEVAYLLSQGITVSDGENTTYYSGSVWGQQLATDDYPVLSDYKVIKAAKGDKDKNGNDTYWATFSNLNSDATLLVPSPRNLTVYNATVSNGKMTLKMRTDSQVAKGEGVLLKTDGEYVNAKANKTDGLTAADYANNNLVATLATEGTITADAGYTLYRLTYNNVSTQDKLGFYLSLVKDENGKVDETSLGKKLKATPGKAYLNVSTEAATTTANAAPARGFAFPGNGETTGIGEIVIEGDAGISGSANANDRIYNLQGQQVTAPVKGLYIKNNKKVIIK